MGIKGSTLANGNFISFSKSYLAGFLGALTFFAIIHFYEARPEKIGTVNITNMVDQFVKAEASLNLSPQLIKNDVKEFGVLLDVELRRFSTEYHLVLLPSEAVISGSRDYTALVKERMSSTRRRSMNHAD